MRKPRNPRYRLKAYYIENDHKHTFYCKEIIIKNLSNEMGASMPLANGQSILETDSDLIFEMNQSVIIGSRAPLLIQEIPDRNVDDKNLNSMRGKPTYITKMLVR